MGKSILWIILGLISIVGGIFALANPLAATLAATTIAGWIFIFTGVLTIIAGFSADGAGTKILIILFGALATWLGVSILGHPLQGVLALTTMVGILFAAEGVTKVIMAFSLEDRSNFWWIVLSGALSIILAIMIFANFPYSAASVLGILLGVDLIFNGVSLVALGMTYRRVQSAMS